MQVHHTEVVVIVLLVGDPGAEGAEIVPKVELARGLDAREDALAGCGGVAELPALGDKGLAAARQAPPRAQAGRHHEGRCCYTTRERERERESSSLRAGASHRHDARAARCRCLACSHSSVQLQGFREPQRLAGCRAHRRSMHRHGSSSAAACTAAIDLSQR